MPTKLGNGCLGRHSLQQSSRHLTVTGDTAAERFEELLDRLYSQAHELHPDDPNKFEVVAPQEWVQNENMKVEILCGRAWVVMEPDKPVVMRLKVGPKLSQDET